MASRASSAQAEPRPMPLDEKAIMPSQAAAESTRANDDIRSQVAEAAYYRAMQRGFTPGFELDDWLQAEVEVLKRLGGRLDIN